MPPPITAQMNFLDWAAIEIAAQLLANDDTRRGLQARARQLGTTVDEEIAKRAWQGAQALLLLRPT